MALKEAQVQSTSSNTDLSSNHDQPSSEVDVKSEFDKDTQTSTEITQSRKGATVIVTIPAQSDVMKKDVAVPTEFDNDAINSSDSASLTGDVGYISARATPVTILNTMD